MMNMTNRFEVKLENLHAGWVELTLSYGDQQFFIDASYSPYDSLGYLTEALESLLEPGSEAVVSWCTEPDQYDFKFERNENTVRLEIFKYLSGRRKLVNPATPIFAVEGEYATICVPLWRALRHLQGRFGPAGINEGWYNGLSESIDELSRKMQIWKQQQNQVSG